MKRILSGVCAALLLLYLLSFPQEALSASREGMGLWLYTLLPTLLPFLILTGILIHTDGIEKIFSPFSGFFEAALGLSPWGAYAFVLGLLCGYPMGAKLAADLYRNGQLSRREAHYLLTFSNNPSPAFLASYVAGSCLGGRVPIGKITAILLLADFFCMLFFRFAVYKNRTFCQGTGALKKETPSVSSQGAIIDVSILNGFETMARLGGYILLFSVLSACVSRFWCFPPMGEYLFAGALELTSGLYRISQAPFAFETRYLLSMVMTAFGGLCILAQTKSVMDGNLSIIPYASAKFLNAAVTALLVLVIA